MSIRKVYFHTFSKGSGVQISGLHLLKNRKNLIKSPFNRLLQTIPSPIFILVFFALKTHNILCAEVSCGYYILCAVKSKRQIFNFGEGVDKRRLMGNFIR